MTARPKPPRLGLRIATGIAAILLGAWGVLAGLDGVQRSASYCLCSRLCGFRLVLLAESRSRKRIVPIAVGAIAALELVPLFTLSEAAMVEGDEYVPIATVVVLTGLSLVLESKKYGSSPAPATGAKSGHA